MSLGRGAVVLVSNSVLLPHDCAVAGKLRWWCGHAVVAAMDHMIVAAFDSSRNDALRLLEHDQVM